MNDNIITVENLGKKYTIGHQAEIGRNVTLRDVVMQNARDLWSKTKDLVQGKPIIQGDQQEEIWALKDVTFELKRGETIGVIGRNGAGKSTLLKILSRITEPTVGRVTIKGRVSSLLEVGTGFHPELTGRENIYLNGAILGMNRQEIRKKFDEIVSFSEVEKFLDTPVKRFSSGMYVRLAFAVAAHLEPEILLVDEVLSVGDAEFQKKCLGKMGDVSKEGRTVVFVSHNMEAIAKLCTRGILLKAGAVFRAGKVEETIAAYLGYISSSQLSVENCARRVGSGGIRFQQVWLTNARGERVRSVTSSEAVSLNLEAAVSPEFFSKKNITAGFGIDTIMGQRLVSCSSLWLNKYVQICGPLLRMRFALPYLPLAPNRYLISAIISHAGDTLDYVEHCADFQIITAEESFTRSKDRLYGFIDVPYDFFMADQQP